jgi:hypothetical protein|tara:strand:- start:1678 stop:1929 length:252 start_codon:yes stop_codon:yes gene_type:complete
VFFAGVIFTPFLEIHLYIFQIFRIITRQAPRRRKIDKIISFSGVTFTPASKPAHLTAHAPPRVFLPHAIQEKKKMSLFNQTGP